ncbi:MAG: 50S ribosomal protein L25/general stress protein Ctc [Candidatus Saccharimonadales bacterium]
MTSNDIAIDLEERSVVRKGLASLRKDGKVPAVIHNHGLESMLVMGDFIALNKVYLTAGKHHPVQLKVAGKQHLALIKHADFDPAKRQLRHIVFQSIKQNEEVNAEIPIVFADVEIPAEKLSLLVLKQLTHVEVKALPKDLPDELMVDPSTLKEAGDHLTVADITLPPRVTILSDLETQIAIVEVPKDQVAAADEAQAELAADAGQPSEAEEQVVEVGDPVEEKK